MTLPDSTITLTACDIFTIHRALGTLHFEVATDTKYRTEAQRRCELDDIEDTWRKIKAEAVKLYPDSALLPNSLRHID